MIIYGLTFQVERVVDGVAARLRRAPVNLLLRVQIPDVFFFFFFFFFKNSHNENCLIMLFWFLF